MSAISMFQEYSQKENHATNNTLLILSLLAKHSPIRFEQVLKSILLIDLDDDKTLKVGLSFAQQVKEQASIPDAYIQQLPFNLYIETKLGEQSEEQVQRHLQSIAAKSEFSLHSWLLSLTIAPMSQDKIIYYKTIASEKSVCFAATTFADILNAMKDVCRDHDDYLNEIIGEYESCMRVQGLLGERWRWLVVFPCGTSLEANQKFGIYSEPTERNQKWKSSKFLGLYTNKKVHYIGVISTVVQAKVINNVLLDIKVEYGQIEKTHEERILNFVRTANYYEFTNSTRFYLMDEKSPINFIKSSKGGSQQHRYIDLCEYGIKKDADLKQVVAVLEGKEYL